MEKLTNQTIYKCSYCSKISMNAGAIHQHEFYCKNNPNTRYLCIACRHCNVDTDFAEDYSACSYCKWFDYSNGDCKNSNDCKNNRKEVKSFICGIDKAKMYSPRSINRSSFKKNIIDSCDRPMKNIAEGCKHYINIYNNEEYDPILKPSVQL